MSLTSSVYGISYPTNESVMITIQTDKKEYYKGDKVIVTGTSDHSKESDFKLRIIVHYVFERGNGLALQKGYSGTMSIEPDENGNFYHVIEPDILKNISGKLLVQLIHQHESYMIGHLTSIDFNYGLSNVITKNDSDFSNEIILSIDNKLYGPDDKKIIVSGLMPRDHIWNKFFIGAKNMGGNWIIVDHNGEFKTELDIMENVVNGDNIISLHNGYFHNYTNITFQYYDPEIIDVVKLDKQVQEIDSDVKQLRTDVNSLQIQLDNLQAFVNEQIKNIMNILSGNNGF